MAKRGFNINAQIGKNPKPGAKKKKGPIRASMYGHDRPQASVGMASRESIGLTKAQSAKLVSAIRLLMSCHEGFGGGKKPHDYPEALDLSVRQLQVWIMTGKGGISGLMHHYNLTGSQRKVMGYAP